ncbi:MAG TPA: hypothetical protein V6D06_14625 [Trichocoleus sp.]
MPKRLQNKINKPGETADISGWYEIVSVGSDWSNLTGARVYLNAGDLFPSAREGVGYRLSK